MAEETVWVGRFEDDVTPGVESAVAAFATLGETASTVEGQMGSFGGVIAEAGAEMDAWAASMNAAGLEFFTFDAESQTFVSNMQEVAATTTEAAAATDVQTASMQAAIPTVGQLNAQFAMMRARLVEVGAAADVEAGQMRLMAGAKSIAADAAKGLGNALTGLKDVMLGVIDVAAKIALVGGAIALVLGGVAVYAAAKFQQDLLKLYTTAGEAKDQLAMVGQGILAMSTDVGIGANKLLEGMYWIESAGFHGAAGLNVLRIAAEGAQAESSDLIGVAHALTGVLNTYATSGLTAAQAMNILIGSVGQGATTLNDLSGAISNVLPAGSKFHLQLIDLTTAIATMTNQNDNAASAATHLRQMILALESPAKAGAAALASIGLSTDALHKAMSQSLPGALQLIIDDLGKKFPQGSAAYNDALKAIAGGNKQLMGMLELSGNSLDKWKQAVKAVTGDVKSGGNAVMGWADVQQNFNVRLGQAWAAVQKLFIAVGTQLLPVLANLLGAVTPLITAFANWVTSTTPISTALGQMGQAFGQVFGPAQRTSTAIQHGHVAMTQLTQAANPFTSTFRTIASVMQTVSNIVAGAIAIWQRIQPVLQAIGGFLASTFMPVWKQLVQVFQSELVPAWNRFIAALGPAMPFLTVIGEIIGVVIVGALMLFAKTIALALTGAISFIGLLVNAVSFMVEGFLKGLAAVNWVVTQIENFFKGLYNVLFGASIIPDIVNAFISWFNKLQTALQTIVGNIVKWITNTWNTMVAGATQWGINLINNILAGLKSAWASVVSWFNGALNTIKGLFPHSPVESGPLVGSEKWGYNFGMNIAQGIRQSLPQIQLAMGQMMLTMASPFSGLTSGIATSNTLQAQMVGYLSQIAAQRMQVGSSPISNALGSVQQSGSGAHGLISPMQMFGQVNKLGGQSLEWGDRGAWSGGLV